MPSRESSEDQPARRARALLMVGLGPSETRFGEYQLLRLIDRGATADVYCARRPGEPRMVALKIMRQAEQASDAERKCFRRGAVLGAALDHPHIVPVLDCGDRDGVPFVAMALIDGRSLKVLLQDGRLPAAESVRIMTTIARAVDHAHARDVLHRDLKPANILIDRYGEPHVVDFGLARRPNQRATASAALVAGTPAYMAPEQASGTGGSRPYAADIYSLGVILYELLTGELPFDRDTVRDAGPQGRRDDPTPPRAANPEIGVALENICLKCLEHDPARRYSSAGALADDLERARCGRPTEARALSPRRRAIRWARRHPATSRGLLAAAALALVTAAASLALWRVRAAEDARVLDTNAFIASGQAGAMLFQLRTYADRVERAARHPAVRSVIAGGKVLRPPPPDLGPLAAGFDSMFVGTNHGRILAHWPWTKPEVFERSYAFRDYFRGMRQLAEAGKPGAYIARAYQSESGSRLEFAVSAAVVDDDGAQLGFIAGTFQAKAAFGDVRIEETVSGSGRIITALLGPRGNDREAGPDAPDPSDLTFVVHPGLPPGAEFTLGAPGPARLRAAFGPAALPGEQLVLQYAPSLKVAGFHDPVPGFGGRWLAAFAPVGRTGFVVLVATPKRSLLPWLR
jgi:eukaryotic-like serine/threonine-protein kinase